MGVRDTETEILLGFPRVYQCEEVGLLGIASEHTKVFSVKRLRHPMESCTPASSVQREERWDVAHGGG